MMTSDRIAMRLGLALFLALPACSADLTGATPDLKPPSAAAKPPPVDPEIVCRDQLTTEVTLHGDAFSVVPIGIPDAPKAALPDIALARGHGLDGSVIDKPEEVLISGNPDADPTNAYLGDPKDGKPRLIWDSREQMRFFVDQGFELPKGGPGPLDEGVWDVSVESANGSSVRSPESLAVVDKPAEANPGTDLLSRMNVIRIDDRQGHHQSLYFGTASLPPETVSWFELPPLPPAGLFDARFSSGGMLQLLADTAESFGIRVQSDSYPVTVSWSMVQPGIRSISIADGTSGRELSRESTEREGSIEIGEPVAGLIDRKSVV